RPNALDLHLDTSSPAPARTVSHGSGADNPNDFMPSSIGRPSPPLLEASFPGRPRSRHERGPRDDAFSLAPHATLAHSAQRDLSVLLRQRVVLTHMRTELKNRVHALIARQGIARTHADLFGAGGRLFLDELGLRPDPRARLDTLLRLIADFDREIDALAHEI